ncbi:hypothetical protein LCGC14_0938560 [marine sediment metagenome]|uniref:Uncharacterized protein n=1 Tax=marine sediment metagenome TaxID=412755 RepID=A0A0F9NKT9_9ZZZZ
MALTPVKIKWSQQLLTTADTEFVVETNALVNTFAIYQPVLMFHNIGDEAATLEIKYTMDLGSETDDPLNSGTYENTVVDTSVPAGGRYPYDFDGLQLDNDSTVSITHTVTITNDGASTHVFHTILTGFTEVQTQFSSANSVIS